MNTTNPDIILEKEIRKVQKKIANKANRLSKSIAKLEEELDALRKSCKHTGHSKIPKSDTGNYDPSCDRYWYECECQICGSHWRINQ